MGCSIHTKAKYGHFGVLRQTIAWLERLGVPLDSLTPWSGLRAGAAKLTTRNTGHTKRHRGLVCVGEPLDGSVLEPPVLSGMGDC